MNRMKLVILSAAVILSLQPVRAEQPTPPDPNPNADGDRAVMSRRGDILSWGTMYGVDDGFVGHTDIRGVRGDELPWMLTSATGSLTTDGHLSISVRGLVFTNDPEVPPELRGINDETSFRALVSCVTDEGHARVSTVNIITSGFPATRSGDSDINTTVNLPGSCVAPIVFVLSGSEDKWFAVTGAETGSGAAQTRTVRAEGAGTKFTLTVSPSTETVPGGSNCKFSMTPTGPNSLTGVRVQIIGRISPQTAQTPDISEPYTTIGINEGSIPLFCTTGHGSKGSYTITATATGIQYPINGQTQTASATLIVQ